VEAIRHFDEDAAVVNIQNNYENSHNKGAVVENYACNINPIDKLIEVMEENKRLYEELLKAKDEQLKLMERLISNK
jgi:hypothetical protein